MARNEVKQFLNNFHIKLKIYRIIFRNESGKNAQILADLEITPTYWEKL